MSNNNWQAVNEAMNRQPFAPTFSQQDVPQPTTSTDNEHAATGKTNQQKKTKTKASKRLKATGLVFIALFIASIFFAPISSSVTSSADATLALESGISTVLPLGTRLLDDDQNLGGMDLTITHSSVADEAKIHIWDYAAEDGDYVQVLVDGVPLGDPFMIYNKPVELTVPTTGEITVLGTHDGGGGITYAIHYDVNGTTYYNGTDVGGGNVYTLIRK